MLVHESESWKPEYLSLATELLIHAKYVNLAYANVDSKIELAGMGCLAQHLGGPEGLYPNSLWFCGWYVKKPLRDEQVGRTLWIDCLRNMPAGNPEIDENWNYLFASIDNESARSALLHIEPGFKFDREWNNENGDPTDVYKLRVA